MRLLILALMGTSTLAAFAAGIVTPTGTGGALRLAPSREPAAPPGRGTVVDLLA